MVCLICLKALQWNRYTPKMRTMMMVMILLLVAEWVFSTETRHVTRNASASTVSL